MAASPEVLRADHLQTLEDQPTGAFYLPLFQQLCRRRGLQPGYAWALECGLGNGLAAEAEAGFASFGIDRWTIRLASSPWNHCRVLRLTWEA